MELDLTSIKEYEMASQMAVFGYVRYINSNTPDLISYTILAYYHVPEYFATHPENTVTLSEDRMTITREEMGRSDTSFGERKLISKNGGKMRWKLKIEKVHCALGIVIGIHSGEQDNNSDFWDYTHDTVYYAWYCDDGTISKSENKRYDWTVWSASCKSGDIICMELDLDSNALGFGINDGEVKIAFNDIKPSEVGYSLAVSLIHQDNAVTLISSKYTK